MKNIKIKIEKLTGADKQTYSLVGEYFGFLVKGGTDIQSMYEGVPIGTNYVLLIEDSLEIPINSRVTVLESMTSLVGDGDVFYTIGLGKPQRVAGRVETVVHLVKSD